MERKKHLYKPDDDKVLSILREEFPFRKEEMFRQFRSVIRDFSENEMEYYIQDGLIDRIDLYGSSFFFNRAVPSLLESVPSLRKRVRSDFDSNTLINDKLSDHIKYCVDYVKDKKIWQLR